jgi:two-component system, cell cycle sensor histidine kinase and response regulator CckA
LSIRILLVEDESMVRTVARRILESNDYEVLEASDGHEALELAAQHGFDIVVTDVVMPRVDGLELISGLADREEPVCAVVTSAYAERMPREAPENVRWWFVPKPYTAQALLAAVTEAVEAAA